ncbi:MAG: hypothetical protein VYA54_04250 [Bdellovibrionota bacterium]|nr:hypothetical protein [Bdellovibrionota bacterium]
MSIYTEMHNKYGNPYYVAEFRLFNLNDCFKNCENCFYNRSGNQLDNYEAIDRLAEELIEKDYQLETCYLLPTDFFENKANLELLEKDAVKSIISKFRYLGIASTLEGELEFDYFNVLISSSSVEQVELQINLINEKLFLESYFCEVKANIEKLRALMGDKIVFNLALNLGRNISQEEYVKIKEFVEALSDDGILEINFTFLYNSRISKKLKSEKLLESLKSMKTLAQMYNTEEDRFNDRTLLRKPSFIFKGDSAYIAPIIPFDEYAYVEDDLFQLDRINFDSFLKVLNHIEKINKPIIEDCLTCDKLSTCMGKAYFAVANVFKLPCFLGV